MSKLGRFAAAFVAVGCAFGAACGFAARAQAADYYVATIGTVGNPGSAGAPFATIAAAIDAAQDGDTIHIAAGDYNEWGLKIGKSIRIEGEEGAVVYGFETPYSGTGRRIFYMTADATIANLTIRNGGFTTDGKPANGGNVFMNAGTVTNCVIEGGYVVHSTDAGSLKGALGGNVFMTGGLVVDCEIKDGGIYNGNGAGGGGNVMMYGGGRLMRCKVTGARRTAGTAAHYTSESGGSGIYMNGAATVENCLVSGNSGSYGAVAMVGAARLVNCTVAGNSGGYNGYNGVILKDGNPWVINCVIDDNGGTAVNEWGNANAGRFVNCAIPLEVIGAANCVWIKNDVATTFADAVSYRPTVDAEFLDVASAEQYAEYALSATDLDGRARSIGGIDIGAYEYDSGAVGVSDYKAITGRSLTFMIESMKPGMTYAWDFGNGETLPAAALTTEYAFPTAGVFKVRLVASKDGVPAESFALVKSIDVRPRRIYVDAENANPVAPYDAPEKAGTTFAEAFAVARDAHGDVFMEGITIEIAPGTYDAANVTLDKRMTICGSGATPGAVVLRANEAPCGTRGRRVFCLLADATIANLTICNGAIETPGTDENGGNVFMKAGTLTNCVVRDGFVLHTKDASVRGALGGNIYMRGGLVTDCSIEGGRIQNVSGAGGGGNVVMFGGGARLVRCRVTDACRMGGGNGQHTMESGGSGVYMNGDTTMENCLVARNGSSFGAVSLTGAAKVVNCTIAGNTGNYEGHNGIYMRDGNPIVVNTIIVGDATSGGSWDGSYGGRFCNCAATAEIPGGVNCLTLVGQGDDYFEDTVDYRPLAASGLPNRGSSELYAQYAESGFDLDLAARIVDDIDIGCYEVLTSDFSCRGSVSAQSARRAQALTFTADVVGADDADITWDFGNGETLATTDRTITYAFPTCGVFTVALTVDAGAKGSAQVTLPPITVVTDALYVNGANASPEAPYDTPARAATSIKTALTAIKDEKGGLLADNVVVHVAPGTYTESGITADRPVRIVGDGASRSAVIVQANENPQVLGAGRVFTLTGGGLLANLTVRNGCYTTAGTDINGGNVYMGDGGVVSNCAIVAGHMEHTSDGRLAGVLGGNLYLRGATAVDCEIRDGTVCNVNGAGGGGNVVLLGTGPLDSGLALVGPGRLVRCRVTGARRSSGEPLSPAGNSGGSGILAIGDVEIENCLVADNAGGSGAVMLKNGARIVQSTVVGNHDNYLGRDGVILNDSGCSALNTAMYNSATNAASEWGNANGSKFVSCASPVEISGGSGCIVLTESLASIFRDETTYCLSTLSPLRDAGSCYLGEDKSLYGVDLRRRPRFVGKAPDIGCCESAGGLRLLVK